MGNTLQKLGEEHEELPDGFQPLICKICREPILSPDKKFKNQNLCVHSFCIDCIAKYISFKVEENVAEIPCPFPDCDQLLDPIDCRNLVDSKLFNKWSEKLCEYSVLGLNGCYCPNRNCSALILNECGGVPTRSECPNCKSLFCFQCKLSWHAGFQCEENEEVRDKDDVAFGELAERKKWQRCPNCRRFIQRSRGCRYITCRCSATFCYKCGKRADRPNDRCICGPPPITFLGYIFIFSFLMAAFFAFIALLIKRISQR